MSQDSPSKLEARWFDKLDHPDSGVRRLTDAYCQDISRDSDKMSGSRTVRKLVGETAEAHMADHIAAVGKI